MATEAELDNWFTYHPPTTVQTVKYTALRNRARELAEMFNTAVPDCADKTAALRKLRDTVMAMNLAIACNTETTTPAGGGGESKGSAMKYLLSWTIRANGSPESNLAAGKQLQDVFAGWTPPEGTTYNHLASLTGTKGWSVVEADDPLKVAEAIALFSPDLDYTVEPVISIEDAVRIGAEAIAAHG